MRVTGAFRNPDGSPLSICTTEDDWSGYAALNHKLTRLRKNTDSFRNHTPEDWKEEEVDEKGCYPELDWGMDPSWFNHQKPWEGWNPFEVGETYTVAWYLNGNQPTEFRTRPSGELFMADHQREVINKELDKTEKLIKTAMNNSPEECSVRLPERYDRSMLEKPHPTYKSIQTTGMQAKRAVLDHIGWLRWWFHGIAVKLPNLNKKIFEEIETFILPFRNSRGVVFYLTRDWQRMNLPLLISNRVPVFYSWTTEEIIEARFSKLNPKLIAADEGANGESISLMDIDDNDEDLIRANRASNLYDNFLQVKADSSFKGGQLAFEMDSKFFIVDFEGWGRRALSDKIDPSRYVERYHFGVYPGITIQEPPKVVFWRWRKKIIVKETDDVFWNRRDDFDDESLIREVYGYLYSPPYPNFYNRETGEERQPMKSVGKSLTKFNDKGKRKEVPLTQVIDSSSESETSSSGAFGHNPSSTSHVSLLHRLSDLSRPSPKQLSNIGSWRKSLRERHNEREESGSSSNRRRSQSPPRSSRIEVSAYRKVAYQFTKVLNEIGERISQNNALLTIRDDSEWGVGLIQSGYLIVIDWRSQARMRYFASRYPDVKFIRQLLVSALSHRLAFSIAIKTQDISLFKPPVFLAEEQRNLAATYEVGYYEAPLEYRSQGLYITAWKGKLTDLLRRPHARAFISMGGPFSWIAQVHGGYRLVTEFMQGPSTRVTVHLKGQTDSTFQNSYGLHWDQVSKQEIDFLFGYIPGTNSDADRWLYPPVQILEDFCDSWNGGWNSTMEQIFATIHSEIERDPPSATPKTRNGWKSRLRNTNTCRTKNEFLERRRQFESELTEI